MGPTERRSSGQLLARRLAFQNAVWGVNALKRDGYESSPARIRGYRLAEGSDLLSAKGLADAARPRQRLPVLSSRNSTQPTTTQRMLAGGFQIVFMVVSSISRRARPARALILFSRPHPGSIWTWPSTPEATVRIWCRSHHGLRRGRAA